MPAKINWIGRVFGKLTVVSECVDKNKVVCKCSCGSGTKEYAKVNLGRCTFSCGCSRKDSYTKFRTEKYFGKKFGELTIISEEPREPDDYRVKVKCLCSCGNYHVADIYAVTSGNTKSCGCVSQYNRDIKRVKPIEHMAHISLYSVTKRRARNANMEFTLTKENIKDLMFKPCTYCGGIGNEFVKENKLFGKKSVKYNGIDRVDSSKGYIIGNVVPACIKCNRAKMDNTLEYFIDWIHRIIKKQGA